MEDLKLAILIDADNISPKYVKVILDEAATFGVAACKRIYGDWSDVRLKSWKEAGNGRDLRGAGAGGKEAGAVGNYGAL